MAKKQKKAVGYRELLCNKLAVAREFNKGLFARAIPDYITDNLKEKLREYQKEALRNFSITQDDQEADFKYRELLFNMATGSGKTMLMAATMLYLFKAHQRQNFLFFVHTDAIIQKTKENFFNKVSKKYLFTKSIEIDGEMITIEEVDVFPQFPEKNTIYLKLSTIHKIHEEINTPRENSITLEDLSEIPLVLLGDEAHHYNATTKGKSKADEEARSWENTIQEILKLRADNRLFEYTATLNLEDEEIYYKFKDKIVYQYNLKQFMEDGFSKRVMLLEANQDDKEKMLDAVLLSQYRKMIATDNGIDYFKPVILFKSNKIQVSKNTQAAFENMIENLTPFQVRNHLIQKQQFTTSKTSVWKEVCRYYLAENFSLESVVHSIQQDFSAMNLLNVNKKNMIEEYPIKLNTLEDEDNRVRAIFAVAKLNEGWDVLNLYDIVRIGEQAGIKKNSTDSEAQLIGRGARYFPFYFNQKTSFKRRFDFPDIGEESLRILEELHYHTINEPSYIKVLHTSLEQANVIAATDGSATIEEAKVKDGFKKTKVYQQGKLYFNETEKVTDSERNWENYSLERCYDILWRIGYERGLDNLDKSDESVQAPILLTFDKRYYYKTIQRNSFFEFDNLKKFFPEIKSIDEFITSPRFLGNVKIRVILPEGIGVENLSKLDKLFVLEEAITRISTNLRRNYKKYKGTKTFIPIYIKDIVKDYQVTIEDIVNASGQRIEAKSTIGRTWFVYDKAIMNGLEHKLVDKVAELVKIPSFQDKYSDVYLIRNDEKGTQFKLTEFDGVRGFMPDFLFIMRCKEDNCFYQVFIEPKGEHLYNNEDNRWKAKMLSDINIDMQNRLITIVEDEKVRLVGLKFFIGDKNNKVINMEDFERDIENRLLDGEKSFSNLFSLEN